MRLTPPKPCALPTAAERKEYGAKIRGYKNITGAQLQPIVLALAKAENTASIPKATWDTLLKTLDEHAADILGWWATQEK